MRFAISFESVIITTLRPLFHIALSIIHTFRGVPISGYSRVRPLIITNNLRIFRPRIVLLRFTRRRRSHEPVERLLHLTDFWLRATGIGAVGRREHFVFVPLPRWTGTWRAADGEATREAAVEDGPGPAAVRFHCGPGG